MDHHLTNLRKLTIIGDDDALARYPDMGGFPSLPPLGKLLPFLEVLCLQEMSGMERLSHGFLGIDTAAAATPQPIQTYAFRRLSFILCNKWKEWDDISEEEENNINISILPCLELLEFIDCPELKELPHRLLHKASSLKYLRMRYCNYLYQRYIGWGAEDRDKISHIPQVNDF
ncbi:hypothetical protein Pfo_024887 [Paulownia fortunei]|nr:hypothetical protein Pfo_024887 [Paulownia fortunei]